jgi:hypothetical protein
MPRVSGVAGIWWCIGLCCGANRSRVCAPLWVCRRRGDVQWWHGLCPCAGQATHGVVAAGRGESDNAAVDVE